AADVIARAHGRPVALKVGRVARSSPGDLPGSLESRMVGDASMIDSDVAGIVRKAVGVGPRRLIEVLEHSGDAGVRRIGIAAVYAGDRGNDVREVILGVEILVEGRVCAGSDISAKQCIHARQACGALLGGTDGWRKDWGVAGTSSGVRNLPLGI